jgi:Ion channel
VLVVSTMFGIVLIVLILLDVYLTVLYARVGAGFLSHHLACLTWRLFRTIGRRLGRGRDTFLSFCGPTILVLLVTSWVFGLMFGGAAIIHPRLGTGVTATSGPTDTSFSAALYIAGDSMTTVGTSDFAPRSGTLRLFFTFLSFIGISMITLTLTYFLEIYNALQSRNTCAVKMNHATGGTGDAAELLAGIGAQGRFDVGYTHLAEMAAEVMEIHEAHHFYGVLLYFRFKEPHYALSRMALITLETPTLIKSALDDRESAWLKESAAVLQMWRGAMDSLTELAMTFLPTGMPDEVPEPDEATRDRWKRRYHAACERLRQAGICTIADEENGAETYCVLRARWDRYLGAFAEHMLQKMDVIDPVGADPGRSLARPDFEIRLRAAS